jgi:hypothetical protein
MNEPNLLWQQPAWLETARDWIHAQLARCQISLSGPIEQPHIRPWSTILRIPTDSGLIYFKASAPYLGHETALTSFLTSFAPQITPQLLAFNLERHWLLMRDSGTPLRAFVRAECSMHPWRRVLPLFVDLQKSLMPRQSELLAQGVIDRRLSRLPGLFDKLVSDPSSMLLDQPESLTSAEYRRLRAFTPRFERLCARLQAFGIPETLHHDDFHDGNVFIQDERVTFTDWGESAVAHPFFTMVVMLLAACRSE